MRRMISLVLPLFGILFAQSTMAQTTYFKCASCGRYHARSASPTNYQLRTSAAAEVGSVGPVVVASAESKSADKVQAASSAKRELSATPAAVTQALPTKRWRFDKANRWTRRIDPRAQTWAQEEANRLAQRGYQGYLQNGHPGGNNPYASVTGTGTTFPDSDLIHTCEGDPGMTLVAEAAAVSWDGRIYGVRSWR